VVGRVRITNTPATVYDGPPPLVSPTKFCNFAGPDWGGIIGIITQVDTAYQLDTALRRYDDTFNHTLAAGLEWGGIFNNKKTDAETGIRTQNPQQISNSLSVV